jgi:hypothetical protein
MFSGAEVFNQSLNDWDVSNVTDMIYMFSSATSFNQSLNDWDISNVEEFGCMFEEASSFNQSLVNWKLSNDCLEAMALSNESTSNHKGKSISSDIDFDGTMKLKYFKNNGAYDLDHNPLTGRKVDFCIAKPFDFNAIIEIGDEVFHINYILIENSLEHDLDYIYIGLCNEEFNVKKWIDPNKSKAEYIKKIYLLGEILIDEDLCEACSVRYIDDFDSHDLDDSYDYKKLLEVRENW